MPKDVNQVRKTSVRRCRAAKTDWTGTYDDDECTADERTPDRRSRTTDREWTTTPPGRRKTASDVPVDQTGVRHVLRVGVRSGGVGVAALERLPSLAARPPIGALSDRCCRATETATADGAAVTAGYWRRRPRYTATVARSVVVSLDVPR